MNLLEPIESAHWDGPFPPGIATALEAGKILIAPRLGFELLDRERGFLSPDCLDGKSKNVGYRPAQGVLQGTGCKGTDRQDLAAMLRRYRERASALIWALCPEYRDRISEGFTSFRPAQIEGRATSWRKDDTLLHVDAFPSRPLQGLRILRVFTNVNPSAPRLWRVGEPFERVAKKYAPAVRPPFPGSSWLLYRLHATKSRRTPYDHLMLGIHDRMKTDEAYQRNCPQAELKMPPDATWACFTDSVSHAAISGQFAFEQTFYLPVDAMREPGRSPLWILERLNGRTLV